MTLFMKISIFVVVAVVVVGTLYAYLEKRGAQNLSDGSETNSITETNDIAIVRTVTIVVDDNGFTPKEIDILKNTQVVFKIEGTRAHWPASDIHPTHGIYPEFDPQRALMPGEEWSFVFTKEGSWRMHDHLSPRMLGRITVSNSGATQ